MNIRYKGTNYDVSEAVQEATTRKMENLGKYLGGKGPGAQAYIELGKAVGSQQTGDIWRAEINLDVDGARFRAEAVKDALETAVDAAVAEMAGELRSAKRQREKAERKGGSMLKSLLRGFWTEQ